MIQNSSVGLPLVLVLQISFDVGEKRSVGLLAVLLVHKETLRTGEFGPEVAESIQALPGFNSL